jgi:inner membrane protein involved in colicin E2 resistance
VIRKKPKTTKYVAKKESIRSHNDDANLGYRKRDSYYQDMEDRIKRMESAIIASGLQGPAGLVDVKEEKEEEEEEEKTSSDRIESQAKLSNQLANLVIDSNGSSNFIGMYCFQLPAYAGCINTTL